MIAPNTRNLARAFIVMIGMSCCSGCHGSAFVTEPNNTYVGLGFCHPLQTKEPTPAPPVNPAIQGRLDHVHVFCINGLDPLCVGNFNGLCRHVKSQGFSQTHFGQLYHVEYYEQKIRQIHRSDPEARFALVGYSAGTYAVRSMANSLKENGIAIDLLVYIGGDFVGNTEHSRPKNVRRILNITGNGLVLSGGNLFGKGTKIDGARNLRLSTRHILLPSRTETIQALTQELDALVAAPPPHPTLSPWGRGRG